MRIWTLTAAAFAISFQALNSGVALAEDIGAPPTSGEPAATPTPHNPPPSADVPVAMTAPPPSDQSSNERTAKNAIYAEGLGAGLFYSLNYDRVFGDFAGRIGFGYLSVGASANSGTSSASAHASFIAVPITVSYLGIGSKTNMLELGAGATILNVGAGGSAFNVDGSSTASGSATIALGDVIVGYRLQPPGGGFLLRAGLSGIIGGGSLPVLPWPYLALGGTF